MSRELENLIESSVALSSTNIILPESLTISMHKKRRWIEGIKGQRFDLEDVEQGVDLDEILATIENSYLKKAMELSGGNKSKAADYLNLSLRSLLELMIVIGIIGILSATAIPNFIAWRNNSQFNGAVNTLAGDLAGAKQSAIQNNATVVITFIGTGYTIFVDDGNGGGGGTQRYPRRDGTDTEGSNPGGWGGH